MLDVVSILQLEHRNLARVLDLLYHQAANARAGAAVNARLLELVNEIGKRKYETFVGRQVEILTEGPSKRNSARMSGRTRCNKIVVFDGGDRHRGQLMDVRITRTGSFTLYGDAAILNL